MIEKSVAVVVTALLLPALSMTGLVSYGLMQSERTMAGAGLSLITLCFVLTIVAVNITIFSKTFGPRTQTLTRADNEALRTRRFDVAAKLWRRGVARSMRWNLLGKLNLAAVMCAVIGLTMFCKGLGLF